jgi:3-hydroxybutyrate dehydrogenase
MPWSTAIFSATDLTGHRALVTGAASGIGAAIASRLAQAGSVVVAVDRDEAGLKTLAGQLGGTQIETFAADLSDLDAIADVPTDIDILVNNAGIQHVAPIEEFPLETFELILDVMLHAPFRLVRQSLPTMYAQGWGRVVNLSSAHGHRASGLQVRLRHGQARPRRVIQGRRARGRAARGHQQLHQSRIRANSLGREADRRPGEDARRPRG